MHSIAGVVRLILHLARVSIDALVPWLGRSSAGALNHKFCAIDCIDRISSFFPNLLFKSNTSINASFSSKNLENKENTKRK
jgi:hypothetical protein